MDPIFNEREHKLTHELFHDCDVRTVTWPHIFNSKTAPKLSSFSIILDDHDYDKVAFVDLLEETDGLTTWWKGITDLAPQLESFALGTANTRLAFKLETIPWNSFKKLRHVYLEAFDEELLANSLAKLHNLPSIASLQTLRLSMTHLWNFYPLFTLLPTWIQDPSHPISRLQYLSVINFCLFDLDPPDVIAWKAVTSALEARGITLHQEDITPGWIDHSATFRYDPWWVCFTRRVFLRCLS